MRLLIAVKSCRRDKERGDHQVIRDTWGKHIPENANLLFFMGYVPHYMLENDEVMVDAPDDYDNLAYKTRAIARWFLDTVYDFVFFCDNDTFIVPERLIRCGFQNYDVAGRFGSLHSLGTTFHYRDPKGVYPDCHPWPSGGIGYFLSRKAAEIIAHQEQTLFVEDMQVGQVLGPLIQMGKITAYDIPSFECNVSWHFPRRAYGNQVYNPSLGWHEKMQEETR